MGLKLERAKRLIMLQSKLKENGKRVLSMWVYTEKILRRHGIFWIGDTAVLRDLLVVSQKNSGTIGKALNTTRLVAQNLRNPGFNCEVGVPFIPILPGVQN